MFEMDTDIYQIWNASIDSDENGLYIIKNDNWNANISAGQSRSFGYLASYENAFTLPENYGISGSEKELAGDSYEITYEVTDMWEDGYVGNITITNLSDKELRNWKLSFDLDDEICDIWNATIYSNENGQYVLHHAEHNAVIGAGGSATIGFRVQDNELQMYPENYAVKVIVQSTMRSDLRDDVIGVAYFEELKAEDYRIEDDGIQYVANQLNLVGKDGVTFDQIADLGTEYEFEIVGYIEFTNDYQVKFVNGKTYEELNELMVELGQNELILEAELNLVSTLESNSELNIPNDTEWADETLWNDNYQNINWGMRSIDALEAWQYEEYMTTVKVGVYDNMFDESQDDLKFAKVWNNWTPEQAGEEWNDHGTHVAGTMAAEYNNGFGISGIAVKKELYAYACVPNKDEIKSSLKTTMMEYKYAFALLIGNGVRVINISYNTGREPAIGASHGNEKAFYFILRNANVMDKFMQRLVDRGYDFVLVIAAGNTNNDRYIEDDNEKYGYRILEKEPIPEDAQMGGIDARYNNFLSSAVQSQDRIIVVGSYGAINPANNLYRYSGFSCIGERVDITAPGEKIYSTVSEDRFQLSYIDKVGQEINWSGTSMAAPHVAGTVALAYSVNPELSGPQIKEMIMQECSDFIVEDEKGKEYKCLNVANVVKKALATSGNTPVLGENTGFVLGRVLSTEEDKGIVGASVCASQYSTFEGNVGTGYLEDYQYTTCTDLNGDFSLELDPGMYQIKIFLSAYKPLIIENVEVTENSVQYIQEIMYLDSPLIQDVSVKGVLNNALNGNGIEGAEVIVRSGWNNYSGSIEKQQIFTDENGNYKIKLYVGYYTIEFRKEGYINSYINIVAHPDVEIQTAVMSPKLDDNEVRVVLTWGSTPWDLDSHLRLCRDERDLQHIYYGNKEYNDYSNGKKYSLDVDDTTQYGPETITFYTNSSEFDEYKYYVYNFSGGSNGDELSFSGARVTIYFGNNESKTINVPVNEVGRTWNVFSVVDGNIIIENTITAY